MGADNRIDLPAAYVVRIPLGCRRSLPAGTLPAHLVSTLPQPPNPH
jgi:hypothetical protein